MGVWIEITRLRSSWRRTLVAPFMGAWIEIHYLEYLSEHSCVAPFMGAWIEITSTTVTT